VDVKVKPFPSQKKLQKHHSTLTAPWQALYCPTMGNGFYHTHYIPQICINHMANTKDIQAKKDYAKLLFVKEDFTQKEIAVKVGVSEKSLSKWVNEGHWDKQKKSLLIAKEEMLHWLYAKLEAFKTKVDSINNGTLSNADADALIKISNTIKNLETQDITLSEIYSVAKLLVAFTRQNAPEQVNELINLFDGLIKERLKNF
jgi:transcriptional regulator with XRE-family HTH domain